MVGKQVKKLRSALKEFTYDTVVGCMQRGDVDSLRLLEVRGLQMVAKYGNLAGAADQKLIPEEIYWAASSCDVARRTAKGLRTERDAAQDRVAKLQKEKKDENARRKERRQKSKMYKNGSWGWNGWNGSWGWNGWDESWGARKGGN